MGYTIQIEAICRYGKVETGLMLNTTVFRKTQNVITGEMIKVPSQIKWETFEEFKHWKNPPLFPTKIIARLYYNEWKKVFKHDFQKLTAKVIKIVVI